METLPWAVPAHILLSPRLGWAQGSRLQVTTSGRRESNRRLNNKCCLSSGHISEEMQLVPAAHAFLLGGEFRDMLAKGTMSSKPRRSVRRPLARSGIQAVQAARAPQGRGVGVGCEAGRKQRSCSLWLCLKQWLPQSSYFPETQPQASHSLGTKTSRGQEPHPGRGG